MEKVWALEVAARRLEDRVTDLRREKSHLLVRF